MTDEDKCRYLFAYDLVEGVIVEDLSEDDFGEYRVRYFSRNAGNWVTIGDGFRHDISIQDNHWDRLLRIINEDQLDQSGLDLIINGWLEKGFPNDDSKRTFISAVKSGKIKSITEYLQR